MNQKPMATPRPEPSAALLRRQIRAVFGSLSDTDIDRLASVVRSISVANMHYGLSAQVACNENFGAVVKDVVDNMSAFQRRELAAKLAP